MRQLRFAPRLQAANAFAFFFVLFASASHSHALTTLDGIDETRVSAVKGVANSSESETDETDSTTGTPTTTVPIIYGGVAGSSTRGTCASPVSNSTCDNCKLATNSETGDNRLLACNNRRVHPNLSLRLFVKSDSLDGVPMLTFVPTGGGDTTAQTIFEGTNSVGKGTAAEISVPWSAICSKMTSSTSGSASPGASCELAANTDQAILTARIGIDAASGTTARNRTLEGEEFIQVQFILRNGIRVQTGTDVSVYSQTDNDSAISYFEIGSGDQKAFIKDNLVATSGFPTSNNINIRWVRALYKQRDNKKTPVWDQIAPDSSYQDLEVRGGNDETSVLDLSPRRITGLTNDQVYDFKLAMVDAARNVGYYTSTDNDQDINCEGDAISPGGADTGSGVPECHTARPSEVVGVLSEDFNCFVATASYGSPMASEVVTFRAFRDRFLKTNAAGRAFVSAYYEYGPIAAKFIAQNETLRAAGRATLWAPLQFVKFSLAHGFVAAFALLSSLIIAPPALWVGVRRIRKPRAS